MAIIINILLLLGVISILTFVHELGHFIAARLVKAKVVEFAIGFGPKIFSKRRNDTLFSLRALPFGGYVKILGDGDPTSEKESLKESGNLKNKSKWAQMFAMLAGVSMNILLAIILYTIYLGNNSWRMGVSNTYKDFKPVGAVISKERFSDVPYELATQDGAFASGMFEKGYIVNINGNLIDNHFELPKELEKYKGQFVDVYACNESEECDTFNVEVNKEGKIGVYTGDNYEIFIDYTNNKFFSGVSHSINVIKLTVGALSSLISEAKESGDYSELSNTVSGPIGIYFIIDYFKTLGVITFLGILADLSLSLALINLLPIPALDGGRFFILLIESILKRDLNEKIENLIINISFALLILFIVIVMIKDIVNIEQLKSLFK